AMTTPKEALALLARRQKVAARYVRGQTQWEIARAFELDQSTISRDLAAIRDEWLKAAVLDMTEVKARELAKVDECERQAGAAWAGGQEDAERRRAGKRGETATQEIVTRGQAGDPRFLDVVLKCVEKRCQILGVYELQGPGVPTGITLVGGVDPAVVTGDRPAPETVPDVPPGP